MHDHFSRYFTLCCCQRNWTAQTGRQIILTTTLAPAKMDEFQTGEDVSIDKIKRGTWVDVYKCKNYIDSLLDRWLIDCSPRLLIGNVDVYMRRMLLSSVFSQHIFVIYKILNKCFTLSLKCSLYWLNQNINIVYSLESWMAV